MGESKRPGQKTGPFKCDGTHRKLGGCSRIRTYGPLIKSSRNTMKARGRKSKGVMQHLTFKGPVHREDVPKTPMLSPTQPSFLRGLAGDRKCGFVPCIAPYPLERPILSQGVPNFTGSPVCLPGLTEDCRRTSGGISLFRLASLPPMAGLPSYIPIVPIRWNGDPLVSGFLTAREHVGTCLSLGIGNKETRWAKKVK